MLRRLQRERDEARATLEQFELAGPKEAMNGKRAGSESAAGAPAKRVRVRVSKTTASSSAQCQCNFHRMQIAAPSSGDMILW